MKMISNNEVLKSWSLQLISVGILVQMFYIELPTEIKEKIPQDWRDYLTFAFLVITFIARILKQGNLNDNVE